ncbi:hypothetical protein ALC57_18760 [Trachymyrmex cornetzi]|uniref:Uncharacterized protein n=1 Tax=Trachymyrmex cornetzi TaxID=471704 RepID=A0A151IRF0_9HYME|nr:hypothetical protein ALC57_18760 [Trachymyrmex cornetzi]
MRALRSISDTGGVALLFTLANFVLREATQRRRVKGESEDKARVQDADEAQQRERRENAEQRREESHQARGRKGGGRIDK